MAALGQNDQNEDLQRGRAALDEGRWLDARAAFEASLSHRETADAHEGLGWALWWLCEAQACVRHRERSFVLHRQAANAERACAVGVDLAITYLVNLGNDAAARGWVARAQRVAEGVEPSAVHGWLSLVTAYVEPDPRRARLLLDRALATAQAMNDVDLELIALADLGLVLVVDGSVDEGMRMLDEAMAGTWGGARRRLETVAYNACSMLAACHVAGDLPRATQWCRVADEFMRDFTCPFLFARCRVHYGSLLFAKGQWARAEGQLRAALELAEDAGPGPRGEALGRLAEIRVRQDRLEEAEELLSACEATDGATLAAAELRIARREPAAAVELLERHLERSGVTASALALVVDAHLASGDIDSAIVAASRLAELARVENGEHAKALSALASARTLIGQGDTARSIAMLEEAIERFVTLDLPFEAARARLELASTVVATQPATAVAEAKHALRGFELMGATAYASRASALLRSLGEVVRRMSADAGVLTSREREVLALVELGLSNPEIAERLFISRKTAAHHVSHLLTKLGLKNRAQLVAHATRTHHEEAPGRTGLPA